MQERMTGQEIEENTLINRWVGEYLKEKKKREQLKREYEKLKQELDLYKTWYRAKHGDIKNTLERYYKALDEIERVCLEDTRTFADGTQVRYDSLDEILDIINKAREN